MTDRAGASPRRGFQRDLLPFQVLMGVTAGGIGGIVTVLGELRDALGFSGTGIGLMVASGFVAAFVSQITLARLADVGHARTMATAGIGLSAAAMLMMVFAEGLPMWVLSRAALGFAGGLILPGVRRAASVHDPVRAGENLGRMVVAETTGFIFGPVLTALLVWAGGIRAPFAVFAGAMLLFVPVAVRLPPDRGLLDVSRRATAFDLLSMRRLQGALVMVGGYFMMIGAWEAVLPVMFADRGAGAVTTGIAFTMVALPIMLVGTRAGRLADRVGPVRVTMAGLVAVSLLTMTYGLIPGVVLIVVAMVFVGYRRRLRLHGSPRGGGPGCARAAPGGRAGPDGRGRGGRGGRRRPSGGLDVRQLRIGADMGRGRADRAGTSGPGLAAHPGHRAGLRPRRPPPRCGYMKSRLAIRQWTPLTSFTTWDTSKSAAQLR